MEARALIPPAVKRDGAQRGTRRTRGRIDLALRTRLSDSVGSCPAVRFQMSPVAHFAQVERLVRPYPLCCLSARSVRRHRTTDREMTHQNQGNPEQRQFHRPRWHGPCHSRRAVAGGNAVELTAATRPRLKGLAAALRGGATAGTFGTAPATWSSLPCRTGHARCARAASPQVSSSLPPYNSNEGCTS